MFTFLFSARLANTDVRAAARRVIRVTQVALVYTATLSVLLCAEGGERARVPLSPRELPPDNPEDVRLIDSFWPGSSVDKDGNVQFLCARGADLKGNRLLQHAVSRLHHVRNLDCEGANGDDELLALTTSWVGLESASLRSGVSDNGLASLERFHGLKHLCLSSDHITDAAFQHLGGLKALESLTISSPKPSGRVKIDGSGLRFLSGLGALESLDLLDCPIINAALKHLECLELKELVLRSPAIDDGGMLSISKIALLERLVLTNSRITDAGLAELPKLRHLCIVSIGSDPKIDGSGLYYLSQVKGLINLGLHECPVKDSATNHLVGMRLKTLNLGRSQITDQSMPAIARLAPSLENLYVQHCRITDAGLSKLKGVKLRVIDLSFDRVTDRGIEEIKGIGTLEQLNLEGTDVTDRVQTILSGIRPRSGMPLMIRGVPHKSH
jgi:hypothetical protein